MSPFLLFFILYILYKAGLFGGNSVNRNDNGSQYQNRKKHINSIASPIILVVRMSSNLSHDTQNNINLYIQRVITPLYFNSQSLRLEFLSTFASYSNIDRNTLLSLVRDAGDHIITCNQNTAYKKILLKHLFEICRISGGMNANQRDFIESFARKINVNAKETYDEYMSGNSDNHDYYNNGNSYDQYTNGDSYNDYERQTNKTSQDQLDKAYKTLGLDPNATDDEVKAKKNKLLRKWHPDLYAQDGEEAIKKATANSQRINEAYDIIKEHRGFN